MLSTKDALIYNVNKKILELFPQYLQKSNEIVAYLRTLSVGDLTLMLQDNNLAKVNFEKFSSEKNTDQPSESINIPYTVTSAIKVMKSKEFSILNLIRQFYWTSISKNYDENTNRKQNNSTQPIYFSRMQRLKFALSLWYSPETCDLLIDYLRQTLSDSELDNAIDDKTALFQLAKTSYENIAFNEELSFFNRK